MGRIVPGPPVSASGVFPSSSGAIDVATLTAGTLSLGSTDNVIVDEAITFPNKLVDGDNWQDAAFWQAPATGVYAIVVELVDVRTTVGPFGVEFVILRHPGGVGSAVVGSTSEFAAEVGSPQSCRLAALMQLDEGDQISIGYSTNSDEGSVELTGGADGTRIYFYKGLSLAVSQPRGYRVVPAGAGAYEVADDDAVLIEIVSGDARNILLPTPAPRHYGRVLHVIRAPVMETTFNVDVVGGSGGADMDDTSGQTRTFICTEAGWVQAAAGGTFLSS